MARQLKSPQGKQGHQIANVQAICGWVKATIKRPHGLAEMFIQSGLIGTLGEEPVLSQVTY